MFILRVLSCSLLTCLAVPSLVLAQSTPPATKYSTARCLYHHVDGPHWKKIEVSQGDKTEVLFQATALCKDLGDDLYPVSGGIRYEGIQNEGSSLGRKWKLVQSEAYETNAKPLSGWQCMVMPEEGAEDQVPAALWCSVVCCP